MTKLGKACMICLVHASRFNLLQECCCNVTLSHHIVLLEILVSAATLLCFNICNSGN